LSLDLLESYARERDIDVRLERRHELERWSCTLIEQGVDPVVVTGGSAREAIRRALEQAGVVIPSL
jgi:hypothetical protein